MSLFKYTIFCYLVGISAANVSGSKLLENYEKLDEYLLAVSLNELHVFHLNSHILKQTTWFRGFQSIRA